MRYFDINEQGKTNVDYLQNLIETNNIIEITAFVFGCGQKRAEHFLNVCKDIKTNIVVSAYIKRMQIPTLNVFLSSNKNIVDKAINFHFKIILARSKEKYFCINSSSNLHSNSKLEFIEVFESKDFYDFFYNEFIK